MKDKILDGLQMNFDKYKEQNDKEKEEEFVPSDEDDDGKIRAPKYDILYSYPIDLGVTYSMHFIDILRIIGITMLMILKCVKDLKVLRLRFPCQNVKR